MALVDSLLHGCGLEFGGIVDGRRAAGRRAADQRNRRGGRAEGGNGMRGRSAEDGEGRNGSGSDYDSAATDAPHIGPIAEMTPSQGCAVWERMNLL